MFYFDSLSKYNPILNSDVHETWENNPHENEAIACGGLHLNLFWQVLYFLVHKLLELIGFSLAYFIIRFTYISTSLLVDKVFAQSIKRPI